MSDDSTVGRHGDPAAERAALPVRSLVFAAGGTTLDVDVLPDSLVGELEPASAGSVVVQTGSGRADRARIDDVGMFAVPSGPPGEVRFRLELDDGTGFVTRWARI